MSSYSITNIFQQPSNFFYPSAYPSYDPYQQHFEQQTMPTTNFYQQPPTPPYDQPENGYFHQKSDYHNSVSQQFGKRA
jgi:hypothetical protein